ncbi:MAG: ISNCY family transposase [Nitrososphaerota archaeon]|nr:ISNCY family transposase [Nitrososphaerota archaeon]
MIRDEDIRSKLRELDEHIRKEYIEAHPRKERDWRTYEQRFSLRIKEAMKSLDPLVHEAVSTIRVDDSGPGRPDSLTLEQKVKLLLIKQLVGESNRMYANMLDVFSMVSGIDVSYKTIERLYSDEPVMMALHNLHVLLLKKKGVKVSDASGDGTGYSLTISKHYQSIAKELKEKAKEGGNARKAFVYAFRLMDLDSRMYIAFGSSTKSEKEAYDRAMEMLSGIDVSLKSIRLDRYYSNPSDVGSFGRDTSVFVIPKRNATLNGPWKWKEAMKAFVTDTTRYLEEYYRRENSESGFAADKKMLGWSIAQKREDRIECANFSIGLWHNLFNLATP